MRSWKHWLGRTGPILGLILNFHTFRPTTSKSFLKMPKKWKKVLELPNRKGKKNVKASLVIIFIITIILCCIKHFTFPFNKSFPRKIIVEQMASDFGQDLLEADRDFKGQFTPNKYCFLKSFLGTKEVCYAKRYDASSQICSHQYCSYILGQTYK